MKNRIITISRQYGSGGRFIGAQAAEALGIPCYDRELIAKIAEKSGMHEDFIKSDGEYAVRGNWFTNALNSSFTRDYLWEQQQAVIEELAEKGPCVIVGRCADWILREKADLLRVFIHAEPEKRAERILRIYGSTEEDIQKRLDRIDRRRRSYVQCYTGTEWGRSFDYDLCLDSGRLGIDRCVEILKLLY